VQYDGAAVHGAGHEVRKCLLPHMEALELLKVILVGNGLINIDAAIDLLRCFSFRNPRVF
jgi:hypothetical protein